jgi:methionyl-tRNA synthetase
MTSSYYYITTPIYYVNAEPHMGHTYTTVLADSLARHFRLRGRKTFFVTGTDEHGEKVLEAAERRGESPGETAAYFSGKYRDTWDSLGISYDRFIRTTDSDHEAVVKQILQKVWDAGQIEFREYEGDYCVGCERFLTDRDLENGLCRDHERAPERRAEGNYFFKMSEHFGWLASYIEEHPDFIRPERYRNEVLSMLREDSGLGDLCISRPRTRLDWGIGLPFDDAYICYVWFDALINYLTAIGYPDGRDFEGFWGASQHLVAKDILKPHAIFWPTMLHVIGLAPTTHLNVHGYWNVDARKVSKSLGNMVSPLIMREKYGFEAFRYYLLRGMSFGVDANFTEEALVTRINSDLANNLGNLVSRTLNMTDRFAGGRVPEPGEPGDLEREVETACAEALAAVDRHMEAVEPHRALEAIFEAVDATNRYLERREPWRAAKDPERAASVPTTLYTCCEALRIAALLLAPFLPETADEILERIGVEGALVPGALPESARWGGIHVGGETRKGSPLFPRVEAPHVEAPEPAVSGTE